MGCCGSESRTWDVTVGEVPPAPSILECIFIRIYEGVLFPRIERQELFPRISCLLEGVGV